MKETMSNSPNHYAVVIIQISHHLNQTEVKGDDTDQIDNQRYDRPLDEQFLFLHHTIHNTIPIIAETSMPAAIPKMPCTASPTSINRAMVIKILFLIFV